MEVINGINYYPQSQTLLMSAASHLDYYDEKDLTAIQVGSHSVMP